MKADKNIEFGYTGGEYLQKMKVRNENLPISADCDSDWISVEVKLPYVTITASPNYGIGTRFGLVTLTDRFGNKITISIEEDWLNDVRIECPEEINIPYTYYNNRDSYDIYVTVYGGSTKSFKTKGLTKMTENVWNISDTYRDYIVRIPQSVNGNFTFMHKDADEYEKYCNEHRIPFDEHSLRKKVRIRQVTESDINGEISVDVCGKTASLGNPCEVDIEYGSEVKADVVKCKYVTVDKEGKLSEVSEDELSVSYIPDWLKFNKAHGHVTFTPNSPNPFANERRADVRLSSPSNPKLYTTVSFIQKSSTIRG